MRIQAAAVQSMLERVLTCAQESPSCQQEKLLVGFLIGRTTLSDTFTQRSTNWSQMPNERMLQTLDRFDPGREGQPTFLLEGDQVVRVVMVKEGVPREAEVREKSSYTFMSLIGIGSRNDHVCASR